MTKTHYYLLLGSIVASALEGCNSEDDGCAHEVMVKASSAKLTSEQACRSESAVDTTETGKAYLISNDICPQLCGDPAMNRCHLPAAYIAEFTALNGIAPARKDFSPEDVKCPTSDPGPIELDCAAVEQHGTDHAGCTVAGRRPAGFRGADHRAHDAVATYLARCAQLEAASVQAFEALAVELQAHNAPAELVAACRQAAREEVAHTTAMTTLAHARGARPRLTAVRPCSVRPLREIALENTIEGIVRESYGAAQAMVAAHTAGEPDVRRAMERIALDEASHAALSARIAAWLDTQLSADEQREVAVAKRSAISDLRCSIDDEPDHALVEQLGVPSRAVALRMFDGLEGSLWSDHAAAHSA